MALLTAGTSTTTVLRALVWNTNLNAADLAALNALAQTEQVTAPAYPPTPVFQNGMLYYPARGALRLFPGDVIAADPVSGFWTFWNGAAQTGGSFVHS